MHTTRLSSVAVTGLYLTGCFAGGGSTNDTDTVSGTTMSGSSSGGESGADATTIAPTTATGTSNATSDAESSGESGTLTGAGIELRSATITLDGVDPLVAGFHFELWAIIDEAPATVGKFNIDAGGTVVDLEGIAIGDATFDAGRDLLEATDFVITIEAAGDEDITPGVSKYLAGPLDGDTSELSVGDARALGDDYSGVAGQFILATPTNGAGSAEEAGVWWLDLSVSPPAPGLVLPELPLGWNYEGWVVIGGVPVSTGRFVDPAASDFADDFSGAMPGPMVPGEDLLENAPQGLTFPADLRGETIVLTIEPEPDDAATPFTLKPLIAQVNAAAATGQNMPMTVQADGFPTASIQLVE